MDGRKAATELMFVVPGWIRMTASIVKLSASSNGMSLPAGCPLNRCPGSRKS
jgi:hypothetical protein